MYYNDGSRYEGNWANGNRDMVSTILLTVKDLKGIMKMALGKAMVLSTIKMVLSNEKGSGRKMNL
jgi:hypothetical protein